jgi:hypothetical protein
MTLASWSAAPDRMQGEAGSKKGRKEMRRGKSVRALLAVSVGIAALLAASTGSAAGPLPGGMPDLVITAFGLESWGRCLPGQTVFTFAVTVKNQGTASWSGVEPAVVVKDLHAGVLDSWGTGKGIDPPLKPGELKTLHVPIKYYAANPHHMTADQPHPFNAVVNGNHVVAESNFRNNASPGPAVWHGTKVVMVGAPQGCR